MQTGAMKIKMQTAAIDIPCFYLLKMLRAQHTLTSLGPCAHVDHRATRQISGTWEFRMAVRWHADSGDV
jgi:hypothetical protein